RPTFDRPPSSFSPPPPSPSSLLPLSFLLLLHLMSLLILPPPSPFSSSSSLLTYLLPSQNSPIENLDLNVSTLFQFGTFRFRSKHFSTFCFNEEEDEGGEGSWSEVKGRRMRVGGGGEEKEGRRWR
ncbi:hypothetical protein LINPERHAP1_LOCUS19373, partial [Linum perenne]